MFQKYRSGVKILRKQLVIIGITLVLLTIGLSGCSDNNLSSKSNQEKILGNWIATLPESNETPIFIFYENGSYSIFIAEQTIWVKYTMTDTMLTVSMDSSSNTAEYYFSNNDNTLTLKGYSGQDKPLILTRQ